MILLILGLIIFFVGQALNRGDINLKKFSGPVPYCRFHCYGVGCINGLRNTN